MNGIYPTDENLRTIREWSGDDGTYHLLMEYVRGCWEYADIAFRRDGNKYYLSTVGWSGNEDIIDALRRNVLFWSRCWESEAHGGHFVFSVPLPTVRGEFVDGWSQSGIPQPWVRWECPACDADLLTPCGENACCCGESYNVELDTETGDKNDA